MGKISPSDSDWLVYHLFAKQIMSDLNLVRVVVTMGFANNTRWWPGAWPGLVPELSPSLSTQTVRLSWSWSWGREESVQESWWRGQSRQSSHLTLGQTKTEVVTHQTSILYRALSDSTKLCLWQSVCGPWLCVQLYLPPRYPHLTSPHLRSVDTTRISFSLLAAAMSGPA